MQTVDDIPIWLRFSDAERELANYPTEVRAVELAKTCGWRHALQTQWDAETVAYAADERRLKFLEVVPLSKYMRALEIGVSLGQHTAHIASRVAHLDAFDIRLANVMFAKVRCEQEGVRNVSFACGGDDCRLPFPDGRFDVVFFNLVLEWCAGDAKEESHEVAQRRMLAEIYRVLKPGGVVQLNTKNRFAFRLLTGGPDEHNFQLPFGSALPRWLLSVILRARGAPRAPGRLYSWRGLRRLLLDAGFTNLLSYWTVPEMRFPEHLVPCDSQTVRVARQRIERQGETRRTNLLMRLTPPGLVKHFAPGLFFLARRALFREVPAPILEQLRAIDGSSRVYTVEQIPEPRTAADVTHKFILASGGSQRLILILSNPVSPELVQRNVQRMRMVKARLSHELGSVIELPVVEGIYGRRTYAIWKMRTPLSSHRLALALQKRLIAPSIVRWLRDVAAETLHRGDAQQYAAFVERLCNVQGLSDAVKASAQVCRRAFLDGSVAPYSVLQHGDLWLGNVLKTPTKTGFMIIDWAGATLEGLPFYDLVNFGCSIGASAKKTRGLMEKYRRAVPCDSGMAMSYVLAGLGQLHQHLEHFPESRFIALCEQKFAAVRSALSVAL
jgi:SAM-dependent methyltransferase